MTTTQTAYEDSGYSEERMDRYKRRMTVDVDGLEVLTTLQIEFTRSALPVKQQQLCQPSDLKTSESSPKTIDLASWLADYLRTKHDRLTAVCRLGYTSLRTGKHRSQSEYLPKP